MPGRGRGRSTRASRSNKTEDDALINPEDGKATTDDTNVDESTIEENDSKDSSENIPTEDPSTNAVKDGGNSKDEEINSSTDDKPSTNEENNTKIADDITEQSTEVESDTVAANEPDSSDLPQDNTEEKNDKEKEIVEVDAISNEKITNEVPSMEENIKNPEPDVTDSQQPDEKENPQPDNDENPQPDNDENPHPDELENPQSDDRENQQPTEIEEMQTKDKENPESNVTDDKSATENDKEQVTIDEESTKGVEGGVPTEVKSGQIAHVRRYSAPWMFRFKERIRILLNCELCENICLRAVNLPCCGSQACRSCAFKEVTAKRVCWQCNEPAKTESFQNHEDLRSAVQQFNDGEENWKTLDNQLVENLMGVRKHFVRIFNKAERNLKKERTKQKRKEREIYNVNEDKGAKHEALPQDGKNLKTIVRPRCAFPIPKVVTLNAHKITKETVAVKYTINAEGFVGQGIAKCFNRNSEKRSVAIFCKVMPKNFDKDKFDPKQLTGCPIEKKSVEVGKLTELTKDEYSDVPPTETEFQLVFKGPEIKVDKLTCLTLQFASKDDSAKIVEASANHIYGVEGTLEDIYIFTAAVSPFVEDDNCVRVLAMPTNLNGLGLELMPGQVVGTAKLLEPDDIFKIKHRNVCAAQIFHQKWLAKKNSVTLQEVNRWLGPKSKAKHTKKMRRGMCEYKAGPDQSMAYPKRKLKLALKHQQAVELAAQGFTEMDGKPIVQVIKNTKAYTNQEKKRRKNLLNLQGKEPIVADLRGLLLTKNQRKKLKKRMKKEASQNVGTENTKGGGTPQGNKSGDAKPHFYSLPEKDGEGSSMKKGSKNAAQPKKTDGKESNRSQKTKQWENTRHGKDSSQRNNAGTGNKRGHNQQPSYGGKRSKYEATQSRSYGSSQGYGQYNQVDNRGYGLSSFGSNSSGNYYEGGASNYGVSSYENTPGYDNGSYNNYTPFNQPIQANPMMGSMGANPQNPNFYRDNSYDYDRIQLEKEETTLKRLTLRSEIEKAKIELEQLRRTKEQMLSTVRQEQIPAEHHRRPSNPRYDSGRGYMYK